MGRKAAFVLYADWCYTKLRGHCAVVLTFAMLFGVAMLAGEAQARHPLIGKLHVSPNPYAYGPSKGEAGRRIAVSLEVSQPAQVELTIWRARLVLRKTGFKKKGPALFQWDGRLRDGVAAPEGEYQVQVVATNSHGRTVEKEVISVLPKPPEPLVEGSVRGPALLDGSITAGKLENAAVTAEKLGPNAVTSRHILDGSIRADDLAAGVIPDLSIGEGSITTSKIRDGTVTAAKIADDAVTAAKIADSSVASADLAPAAVEPSDVHKNLIQAGQTSTISLSPGGTKSLSVTFPQQFLAGATPITPFVVVGIVNQTSTSVTLGAPYATSVSSTGFTANVRVNGSAPGATARFHYIATAMCTSTYSC